MTTAVEEKTDALPSEEIETIPAEEETYSQRYRRAKAHAQAVRGFYVHFATYVTVCAFLFALNMLTNRDALWFYWPVLGWGIFVAIQAVTTFSRFSVFNASWEERKVKEYMDEDRG